MNDPDKPRRDWRIVEEPAYEPVSLVQAKEWIKAENDLEDALIALLIKSARERAEAITGRAFVQRRVELILDYFPTREIKLPCAPLIEVESITYIDSSGDEVEMSEGQWREVTSDTGPGRLEPSLGGSWPGTADVFGAVRIVFLCGYAQVGSPADEASYQVNIPAAAKNWMEVRLASFYENRESLIVAGKFEQPPRDFVDGLLDNLRVDFGLA